MKKRKEDECFMNTNDITIIPLGTVSPYPKDNRNCPAFLIRYKDYFSERKHFGMNGNYKKKIALYICLQIFIILSSFCYQVYITKYILIVNFDSKSSSKNISSRQSLLNTDFSDKEMESSQNLQYNSLNNTEMNNNNATINNSGTEGDESNVINDQED